MDIEKFTVLLENTMKKAADQVGGMDKLNCCMSRPSGNLVELYGPMTNKLLKARAKEKAQFLYDNYRGNRQFDLAVQSLGNYVDSMGLEATNGAVSTMGALNHIKDTFGANLKKVLEGVKEPPSKLEGVLLAVADMTITSALAFVPVAGPFLVPLSQGLNSMLGMAVNGAMTGASFAGGNNSMLFVTGNAQMKGNQKTTIGGDNGRQDLSDGATTVGKTVNDGVKNITAFADKDGTFAQLAAQKGVASLIVTAVKLAVKANDAKILAMADSNGQSFAKIVKGTSFSQNQEVGQGVNTLGTLGITMPPSLAADPKRQKMYLDEKASLGEFKDTTAKMFKDFFDLLVKIMNAGIEASFKEATQALKTPDLDEGQKIALLILGYFYSKDWDGNRAKQRQEDLDAYDQQLKRGNLLQGVNRSSMQSMLQSTNQKTWDNYSHGDVDQDSELFKKFDKIERLKRNMSTLDGEMLKIAEQIKLLSTKTGLSTLGSSIAQGTSARKAYDIARSASSSKGILLKGFADMGDLEKLPTFESKAQNYFKALKSALTADIESAMARGNSGFLGDDDFTRMWKLFIGSQLIVNFALNDSKIKLQSGSARKFFRAITPTTDATAIPDYYVKMIEDAGFIERYSGDWKGQVSVQKKKDLAATGRMRWSRSPSNTERAMLISFCTVVAFTMDVGRISLGFYSWKDTQKSLNDVCKTISATAWTA